MLNIQYFDKIWEEKSNNELFEAVRPIGSPLILFSLIDGSPLASIHFLPHRNNAKSLITKRPKFEVSNTHNKSNNKSIKSEFDIFQGIINSPNREFQLVITNLSFEGYINFNLLKTNKTVNEVNPGGLNEVNELKPGQSYAIKCDQANNRELILSPITTKKITKNTDSNGGEEVHLTLREDEKNRLIQTSGTYFYLSVVPETSKEELIKKFKSTKWACVDIFVRKTSLKHQMSHIALPNNQSRDYMQNYGSNHYGGLDNFDYGSGWYGCPIGHPGPRGISQQENRGIPELSPFSRIDKYTIKDKGPRSPAHSGKQNANLGTPGYLGFPGYLGTPGTIETTPWNALSNHLLSLPGNTLPYQSTAVDSDFVMSSIAGKVTKGQEITVNSQETGLEYDYDTPAKPCILGLAINEKLEFNEEPSREELEEKAKMIIYDSIQNNSKYLLNELTEIFHEENCCLCLEEKPNIVFYQCGHQCCHSDCVVGIRDQKCPLCRNYIIAKIKV